MTNTNKMEVIFEELCDEQIASISGGTSTARVTVSGDGRSASATALVSNTAPTVTTSSPSPTSVFNITPILDSSVNSLPSVAKTYTLGDGGGISVSITLP